MSLRLSQIGVTFHPVEVEKNVFAPSVETMILKVSHYTGQNRGEKKKLAVYSSSSLPQHTLDQNDECTVYKMYTCTVLLHVSPCTVRERGWVSS